MFFMQDMESPLLGAASNNRKECIELLLKHGADPNIKNRVSDGY